MFSTISAKDLVGPWGVWTQSPEWCHGEKLWPQTRPNGCQKKGLVWHVCIFTVRIYNSRSTFHDFLQKLDSHRKSELPTDRSVRAVADCKACIPAFNTNIQLDISFLISIQKFTMESHGIFWIELVSLCVFCWWSSSSWQVTPFKKLQEDVGNKQWK